MESSDALSLKIHVHRSISIKKNECHYLDSFGY